jgi:hypothetical protein
VKQQPFYNDAACFHIKPEGLSPSIKVPISQIMKREIIKWCAPLSVACLLLMANGCTLNAHRMHPDFDTRVGLIKKSVLIRPDVSMYELSPVGTAVLRDDWSRIGRENLQIAILKDFSEKERDVKLVEKDVQTENEIKEIQALYRLVHKTMDQHTFGSRPNTANSNDFVYSLGPLETFLQRFDADSIIFVSGYDQIFYDGRKALIDLAIADSTGAILYYSVKGTTNGKDLRDPDSTMEFIRDLLASFSRMEG